MWQASFSTHVKEALLTLAFKFLLPHHPSSMEQLKLEWSCDQVYGQSSCASSFMWPLLLWLSHSPFACEQLQYIISHDISFRHLFIVYVYIVLLFPSLFVPLATSSLYLTNTSNIKVHISEHWEIRDKREAIMRRSYFYAAAFALLILYAPAIISARHKSRSHLRKSPIPILTFKSLILPLEIIYNRCNHFFFCLKYVFHP